MLIASLFLLWIIVILLVVAVVALTRQVRLAQSHLQLRSAPLAIRSAPAGLGGAAPVISMPTLAGDMLTVGGVSADARAQLLLFIGPGCPASLTAVLIDAQGRLLARGPAATREQIDALLAHVQRPVAEPDEDDVAAQLVTSTA